jgi:hypothetical protein
MRESWSKKVVYQQTAAVDKRETFWHSLTRYANVTPVRAAAFRDLPAAAARWLRPARNTIRSGGQPPARRLAAPPGSRSASRPPHP